MRFFDRIRAAPFEFCLYGFSAFALAVLVAGLAVFGYSEDIPAVRELVGIIVALAYVFGLIPSFFAAAAGLVILLIRRLIWPRKAAFCVYELMLHLIIALPLMAFAWYMFYIMIMVA